MEAKTISHSQCLLEPAASPGSWSGFLQNTFPLGFPPAHDTNTLLHVRMIFGFVRHLCGIGNDGLKYFNNFLPPLPSDKTSEIQVESSVFVAAQFGLAGLDEP